MHGPSPGPEWAGQTSRLLRDARAGSAEALGRLLEGCRAYLLLAANEDLDPDLRAKGGASDLVQQTFLEAQQDFPRFEGSTGRELLGWLVRILRHNLADFRRRYRDRYARQVTLERPLDAHQAEELRGKLTAPWPAPPDQAAAAEEAAAVREALGRLPGDYRRVLSLRHERGLSFVRIGAEMGRTDEAARKLWFRAVEQLRQELKAPHESR